MNFKTSETGRQGREIQRLTEVLRRQNVRVAPHRHTEPAIQRGVSSPAIPLVDGRLIACSCQARWPPYCAAAPGSAIAALGRAPVPDADGHCPAAASQVAASHRSRAATLPRDERLGSAKGRWARTHGGKSCARVAIVTETTSAIADHVDGISTRAAARSRSARRMEQSLLTQMALLPQHGSSPSTLPLLTSWKPPDHPAISATRCPCY